jgi:hypothetical protein
MLMFSHKVLENAEQAQESKTNQRDVLDNPEPWRILED